jgi:xanthosine utilization system XapX-like protein
MSSPIITSLADKPSRIILLVLIVFTPLAYGAVHVWAYTLMEMLVLTMVALALVKIIWSKREIRWVKHPVNIILSVFGVYICMQMISLPQGIIEIFSPEVMRIHQKYLDWISLESINNYFTFSLYTQRTQIELIKVLAYFGIFLFTINMVDQREQINLVVLVIILVGCFEGSYAIYEKLSEIESAEWGQRNSMIGSAVTGTYINRNNFAGYLEMVIVLLFGQVVHLFTKKRRRKNEDEPRSGINLDKLLRDEAKHSKMFLRFAALFLMMAAIILSQSRGGVLSVAVGMSVVIAFSYRDISFKGPMFFFAR